MELSKAEATKVIAEVGLSSVPVQWFKSPQQALQAIAEHPWNSYRALVIRTTAPTEVLNLPRLVNASQAAAASFISNVPPGCGIIIQPMEELLLTGQAYWNGERLVFEVVRGVWELNAALRVTRLEARVERALLTWSPLQSSAEDFHENEPLIADLRRWAVKAVEGLDRIRRQYGEDVILKFHISHEYGISGQNLHFERIPVAVELASKLDLPVIRSLDFRFDAEPSEAVIFEVAVERSESARLYEFATYLEGTGVKRVLVRSGILSHVAIILREVGLMVAPVSDFPTSL